MVGQFFAQTDLKMKNEKDIQSDINFLNRGKTTCNLKPLKSDNLNKWEKWWKIAILPALVIVVVFFLIILLPMFDQVDVKFLYLLNQNVLSNHDSCSFKLVESIPEGLIYVNDTTKHISTFETWKNLIELATHTIEIGSFYWTLRKSSEFPQESSLGDEIFNDLLKAATSREISIKIARNKPSKNFPSNETEYLLQQKSVQVKYLDFDAIVGAGVLHSKFWIVDRKHFYLGSANLDWRALNQVKELGIAIYNCSLVAQDLGKIFDTYWMAGNVTKLPSTWPSSLSTIYNSKNPFNLTLNGESSTFFISNSPPKLTPSGRNDDLNALLMIIKEAKQFVHISVMDYLPLVIFSKNLRFWPDIDNELRKAVIERQIQVRLLISRWKKTKPMTLNFLNSLLAINKFKKKAVVEIKWFEVPANNQQNKIPFARVNHNKYMVTDNGAFIGTSNWSGDYFLDTAGVSFVFSNRNGSSNSVQKQLKDIFDRDWNSNYTKPLLVS